jgi:hypothetical protein
MLEKILARWPIVLIALLSLTIVGGSSCECEESSVPSVTSAPAGVT